MKLGILEPGQTPPALRARHGLYDAMFRRLFAGRGFDYDVYRIEDGALPEDVHSADAWLVTGSRHAAYEPHPWIAPLEAFLRAAYAAHVPILGVCFGHQILAQALGGKVEKYAGGWSVGPQEYRFEGASAPLRLLAFHQDQVVAPPPEARVVGESDFCRNAALVYGDRAFSVQPHPEFDRPFVEDLLEARRDALSPAQIDAARARDDWPLDSARIAERMAAFLERAVKG